MKTLIIIILTLISISLIIADIKLVTLLIDDLKERKINEQKH